MSKKVRKSEEEREMHKQAKIIRNNNMIRYENLSENQMIGIYYLMSSRYYNEITNDEVDIKWKGDIKYEENEEENVKEPNEILAKEKIVKINITDDGEEKIEIKLHLKGKTFSIKGKAWALWEEEEKDYFEDCIDGYEKEQSYEELIKKSKEKEIEIFWKEKVIQNQVEESWRLKNDANAEIETTKEIRNQHEDGNKNTDERMEYGNKITEERSKGGDTEGKEGSTKKLSNEKKSKEQDEGTRKEITERKENNDQDNMNMKITGDLTKGNLERNTIEKTVPSKTEEKRVDLYEGARDKIIEIEEKYRGEIEELKSTITEIKKAEKSAILLIQEEETKKDRKRRHARNANKGYFSSP